MPLSIAIVGFRHPHIFDLVERVKENPETQLVAICEEDAATREQVIGMNLCDNVFESYERMLNEVECEVIGVGDYYGIRGQRVIEALKRGKHVIGDKPLSTSLAELDEIEKLVNEGGLMLGCQLDMRDNGNFLTLHQLIHSGELGQINAISFGGQHPLNYGVRAGWYFEEGKHGGTLNDIGIHAFDAIPWLTGHEIATVSAARGWNAALPEVPHFEDAAQVMFTLDNGCGVLGDVSYFAPNSHGYGMPHYWRTTIWGSGGVAETSHTVQGVSLFKQGEKEARVVEAQPANPGGYLQQFLAEIADNTVAGQLTTASILKVSRISLQIQEAADKGLTNVNLAG